MVSLVLAAMVITGGAPPQSDKTEQKVELNFKYSAVSGVPGTNGFTAVCGRVCSTTIQPGPKPSHMFGGGFAYFLRDHFGMYGDLGIVRKLQHDASAPAPIPSTFPAASTTTTASRKLIMFSGGLLVSDRVSFAELSGYGGVGALHDRYEWSTKAVQLDLGGAPISSIHSTNGTASPTRPSFQFGAGVRMYVGKFNGVQLFGDLNSATRGLEDLSSIEISPTGIPFSQSSSRKLVGRLGVGYFVQWQRHPR